MLKSIECTSSESVRVRQRTRRYAETVFLIVAILLLAVPMFSQTANGRITGTVKDSTGGSVAGAMVTVTDVARGLARNLTTDEAGAYLAPNLIPGTYSIRVTYSGFQAWERTNILLGVGGELAIDAVLLPGSQTQTVTITEEVPLVNTTSATLGGTLSNDTIVDLPLNGRNYQNLLLLRPGTIINPGGNERQSTNGLRGTDNVYLVEGLANDEVYTGLSMLNAPTLAGDVGVILPVDSIQEFGSTSNSKAETGLKPGGVVNVGIKSGTNSLHGSAFAFGRGTSFNARNFFNTPSYAGCQPNQVVNGACPLTPISLQQWGATAGGPIKKDKLFWFGAYEQQRYSVGQALPNSTPVTCAGGAAGCGLTAADTTKSFQDALQFLVNNGYTVGTSNCTKSALTTGCTGVTPAGVAVLNAKNTIAANSLLVAGCTVAPAVTCTGGLFPANNGSNGTTFQPNLLSNTTSNNGVGKISYNMNDRNNFGGTFYFGEDTALFNDSSVESRAQWESRQFVRSYLIAGSWTYIPSSSWVNELHMGLAHYQQKFDSADIGIPVTSYVSPSDGKDYSLNTGVANTAFTGYPIVTIAGFNLRLGGSWPKYIGPDAALQFSDHVSYLRGNHAFKFGGEFNRLSFVGAATTNSRGNLAFGSSGTGLVDFFTGLVGSASVLSGDPFRNIHNYQSSFFGQDDWRIRPRVTLNLGLRYEYFSVLKEKSGRFANFIPNIGPVQVGQQGLTRPYQPDYNNISPRVGLAWDIQGNGKTTLRTGASIIYSQLNYISLIGPGNGIGLGTVCTGCSSQISGVTTVGPGTIAVNQAAPSAVAWNSSTLGGTTIFPASALGGSGGSPLVCGDGRTFGAVTDASPCNMNGIDPHLRTPYVTTWTLDVQRAITTKISLDVAYVGTHGTKLLGFLDQNQPPVGAGWTTPASSGLSLLASCVNSTNAATYTNVATAKSTLVGTGTGCNPGAAANVLLEQSTRPYTISCAAPIGLGTGSNACLPQWKTNPMVSNIDQSNYNALQVAVTGRPTHGVSFNVAYTWSHALDYASSNFGLTTAPDSANAKHLQYGPSGFDRRNVLNISTTYQVPNVKAVPWQLLSGWALNSIIAVRGGVGWSPSSGDFSGTGDGGSFWNFYGNPKDLRSTGPRNAAQDLHFFLPGNKAMADADTIRGSSAYAVYNTACASLAAAQVGPSVPLVVGGPAVPTNGMTSLMNLGCYVQNGSVLLPPAFGTWSQNNRGIFRAPSFKIWDLSFTKNTKITERFSAQFRAEFFNMLNHPTFTTPSGNPTATIFSGTGVPNQFGSAAQTLDAGGQNPVVGSGGPRSMQLGLKITF